MFGARCEPIRLTRLFLSDSAAIAAHALSGQILLTFLLSQKKGQFSRTSPYKFDRRGCLKGLVCLRRGQFLC